jgi:hypothetical protein
MKRSIRGFSVDWKSGELWLTRESEPHHQYTFDVSDDRKRIARSSTISPDDVPTGDPLSDADRFGAEAMLAGQEFLDQEAADEIKLITQPPNPGWMPRDDRGDQVAHMEAERRRNFIAATSGSNGVPPLPPAQPPNPGWMNFGNDGNQVANMEAQRRRNFIAAGPSGIPFPLLNSIATPPEPFQTVEFSASGNRRAQFEQRLLETPAEIRDAAHDLAGAIEDQIHVLNASKPNEGDDVTKHNAFVDFLAYIAGELRKLAEALDRAIAAAASAPDQQRMFLGTAGKIADRLQIAFGDWFEQNATNVAGYSIRIGLFAAAFGFLRACGVDGDVATLASAILNKSIPEQK